MKSISKHCDGANDLQIFTSMEAKYVIQIRNDIKEFLAANSGGYPLKNIVKFEGEEYEVRVFLSLDIENRNYYIEKPLEYFLEKTKGKIIPVGIDSGDNYYCVNNETGKVYYWTSSDNQYYCIANSLIEFNTPFE